MGCHGGAQTCKKGVRDAAPRVFFLMIFVDFWKRILVLTDRILENTEVQKIRPQRDRDDRYVEAVPSRGQG